MCRRWKNCGPKWCRAAAEFYERLRQTHVDALPVRFTTARAYGTLSALQLNLGRIDESIKTCRQAVGMMRTVVAEDPGNSKYQCQLAMVINDLAGALNEAGQLAETETCSREAVAIQEPLVQSDPRNRDYRRFLANMQFNLGMILDRTGRHAEAEPWYQQAVNGYAELVRTPPNDRADCARLAECRLGHGWLLKTTGRRTEAEVEFRSALAITDALLQEAPTRSVLPVDRVLGLSLPRRRVDGHRPARGGRGRAKKRRRSR